MTWPAFLSAMRTGLASRSNAARQGVGRAAQQTSHRPASAQSRAVSKVNKRAGNDNANCDFLVIEEVCWRRRYRMLSIFTKLLHLTPLVQHACELWKAQIIVHN